MISLYELKKYDTNELIYKTEIDPWTWETNLRFSSAQFSCSVMSNSANPCSTAQQASLSITNSQSSPKPMSIELVMPSKSVQHHSSKASILWCSAFFIVQLSHPYMTTGKTITLTRWTFVGKVMSFQGVSVF